MPNFINGFGGGFVFVPLTTMAMGLLRKQEIGNAAGIYNLIRNIGGSIGIAALTALLVRGSQMHQNYLGAHLTANSPAAGATLAGLTARFSDGGRRCGDGASGGVGRALPEHAAAGGGAGLRRQLQAARVSHARLHSAGSAAQKSAARCGESG